MGNLGHVPNVTLDLFIEDERGSIDSGATSNEPFVHLTNLIRPLGTHLYGRRIDQGMAPRETGPEHSFQSDLTAEFAGIGVAASRGTSR
jgi:hypothetical protein